MNEKQIIQQEVMPVISEAKAIVVKNPEQRQDAVAVAKALDQKRKELDEKWGFTRNKTKTYEAYKSAMDTLKAFETPFNQAKDIIKAQVNGYDRQVALEAQKKRQLEEAKRLEAERKERERLEAMARKAEEKGKIEKAEALREASETVQLAPTFTPPEQPSRKLVTKARVTNVFKLCKLIADGVIPWTVIEVKQGELNSWAKAQDVSQKYDGVELYEDLATSRVA